MHQNTGFVYEPIVVEQDYIFGGYTKLGGEPLQPTGQWDDFIPVEELQFNNSFDTMSCATFGTLNAVEILMRRVFGRTVEYSDRFLSKASGTTEQGNTPNKVAETLRKTGVVREDDWSWKNVTSFKEFMSDIPRGLYVLAQEFCTEFAFGHEYVPNNPMLLKAALQHSPLGVSVVGWYQDEQGLFYKPAGMRDSHWTVIYGYEDGKYWKCLDTYNIAGQGYSVIKKIRWDTQFEVVKRYSLERQVHIESFWKKFVELLYKLAGLK